MDDNSESGVPVLVDQMKPSATKTTKDEFRL